MSCCDGSSGLERYPGTGCCGTSCVEGEKTGCLASEARIRSCCCQENVGCLDRPDCGGFRPRGTAATGACPGPCQCAEEEAWNRNVPPKPNCEWLSNFSELRRQWSDHGRQNNCKCCNCKPCRTAEPCSPCLTPPPPPPAAAAATSTVNFSRENYQPCCINKRLAGGACDGQISNPHNSPSHQRDRSSGGGCPLNNYSCTTFASTCRPSPMSNMYSCSSPPCSSPSECSIENPWAQCRPPGSCQPCSPSPRPILKKRSCCQCITGCCLCQPMPRTCNCPPPVQVDARASHECSCDCPSSPECACPPSERRFPRTKVKCPNARLCCPTPRAQPGPKCRCTKCQPCLPPPCDSCTSNKCRTVLPKVKPCYGDSSCNETAPCNISTTQPTAFCQPALPQRCVDCGKMPSPCHPPTQHCTSGAISVSRPSSARQIRLVNRPRSPDSQRCTSSSAKYRSSSGQSRCRVHLLRNNNNNNNNNNNDNNNNNNHDDAKERLPATNEGFGDNDGEADPGCRGAQCHCGSSDSRGWHKECHLSYSSSCSYLHRNQILEDNDDCQCNCGDAIGCSEECDYCCSLGCDRANEARGNNELDLDLQGQCACGPDKNSCAQSCDYCCSQNCDSEPNFGDEIGKSAALYVKSERIAAGGSNFPRDTKDNNKLSIDEMKLGDEPRVNVLRSTDAENFSQTLVSSDLPSKCGSRLFTCSLTATPEVPELEALSHFLPDCVTKIEKENQSKAVDLKEAEIDIGTRSKATEVTLVTDASPSSACKILRCLIRAKSPLKYLHR